MENVGCRKPIQKSLACASDFQTGFLQPFLLIFFDDVENLFLFVCSGDFVLISENSTFGWHRKWVSVNLFGLMSVLDDIEEAHKDELWGNQKYAVMRGGKMLEGYPSEIG
jgi:hypothetical protein